MAAVMIVVTPEPNNWVLHVPMTTDCQETIGKWQLLAL
jgi:hypothetical protein